MAFTLTMLGTDTYYNPEISPKPELRGDTLSIISTFIEVNDFRTTDKIVKVHHNKAAVVDGPDTMGTEVGDRIARGLIIILEALARGETQFVIQAHSRGAVCAILIAHELQRIRNKIGALAVSKDALCKGIVQSPCRKTQAALNIHCSSLSKLDSESFLKLFESLEKIQLSIFNIDPVPGGNFLRVAPIGWMDARFLTVPPIVKDYQQIILCYERTECFEGLLPTHDEAKTTFKIYPLPGHHGTASGNLDDQKKSNAPGSSGELVKDVQELTLILILNTLMREGAKLRIPSQDAHYYTRYDESMFVPLRELLRNIASAINNMTEYDPSWCEKIVGNLCRQINKNIAGYKAYRHTTYPVLGKKDAPARAALAVGKQTGFFGFFSELFRASDIRQFNDSIEGSEEASYNIEAADKDRMMIIGPQKQIPLDECYPYLRSTSYFANLSSIILPSGSPSYATSSSGITSPGGSPSYATSSSSITPGGGPSYATSSGSITPGGSPSYATSSGSSSSSSSSRPSYATSSGSSSSSSSSSSPSYATSSGGSNPNLFATTTPILHWENLAMEHKVAFSEKVSTIAANLEISIKDLWDNLDTYSKKAFIEKGYLDPAIFPTTESRLYLSLE